MTAWLAHQARHHGKAAALVQGAERVSYADLARRAARHAAVLAEIGVRRGDHVFVQTRTTLNSATWLHAVVWLGAALVPLDPELPRARTRQLVRQLEPTALIATNAAALGSEIAGACPIFDADSAARSSLAPVDPAPYDPARRATVMLTSGSTCEPRAVPLTLENHRASALAIARRLNIGSSDQWLLCLPLNHIGGLAVLVRSVITGSTVCFQPNFDPAVILGELADQPHTLTSMVPAMLQRLMAHQAGRVSTRLRVLLVGGAPASPALLRDARGNGWPVVPTWGMTEACSQVATLSPDEAGQVDFEAQPGIAGRPLPGVEVRIGSSGTLQIRGPMVFSGYLPDGRAGPDADGWFATGDTGKFMPDGSLAITGRVDDVIISGGVNVNLEAVRRRLAGCPLIGDIALVALEDPDWGQRIGAVVKPRDAHVDADTLVGPLADWSRQRLTPAERPLEWRVVDNIPASASGKTSRKACAALFEKS